MVVRVESFKGAPVEGNGYGEEMPLEDMIQRAFFSKFTVGNSTSGGAGLPGTEQWQMQQGQAASSWPI